MRNIVPPAAPARAGGRAVDAVHVQPLAPLPGRHRRRGAPARHEGSRSSSSSRTTVSTSRSSSSTRPGSGTCVQGDLGKDYQSGTAGDRQARSRAAGLARSSCSTRRSSRCSSRSRSACSPRTAPTPRPTAASTPARSRSWRCRASCSRSLLAYFVGVKWQPDIPLLGQIPVTGYEPGWLEPLFGQSERRHRPALRHPAAPGDLARRRAWSRCTCGCCAAT